MPGLIYFERGADEFLRALHNASLFMYRADETKPGITGVRFEYEPGTRASELTLVSTDCYRICFQTVVTHHGGRAPDNPCAFTLAAADVKVLLSAHKDSRSLMLVVSEKEIKVEGAQSTTLHQFEPDLAFIQNWRQHVPSVESLSPADAIAFPADLLQRIGKVRFPKRHAGSVKIALQGSNRPALVQFSDGPTVVTMPTILR